MTLNAAQSLLYVVEDETDTVDVIATASNAILETIPVIAPPGVLPTALAQYTGANSDSATLSEFAPVYCARAVGNTPGGAMTGMVSRMALLAVAITSTVSVSSSTT